MNRLRKLREKKKLSLSQLGKELNMSASVLGNYEREDRQPKTEVWEKIASYFEVDTAYIMGLTNISNIENPNINNIKEYREYRNLSIEQLSELTNIPIDLIIDYEEGNSLPESPSIWNTLANALSVPVTLLSVTSEDKQIINELDQSSNSLKRKDYLISKLSALDYQYFSEFTAIFSEIPNIIKNYSMLGNENKIHTNTAMNLFIKWCVTETKIMYFQENVLTMTEKERSSYMRNNFSSENWEDVYTNQKQLINKLVPLLNNPQ